MHCIAEGPFNDTLPFIKLGKYTKISTGSNTTKGLNVTEKLDMEISRMKKRESIGRYMCKNYEIIKDGDAVSILETIKLERSVLVEHVLDHIRMDDDAEYSCVAFNDVGFSKETLYLHVTPRKFFEGVFKPVLFVSLLLRDFESMIGDATIARGRFYIYKAR